MFSPLAMGECWNLHMFVLQKGDCNQSFQKLSNNKLEVPTQGHAYNLCVYHALSTHT